MPIRTVRGHVILTEDTSGEQTVMVGTSLTGNEVQNVWVRNVGPRAVRVDRRVQFADGRVGKHSVDVVEVNFSPDGLVEIRRVEAYEDLRASS